MIHKPNLDINSINFLTFEESIIKSNVDNNYDSNKWIYAPPYYDEYRYILGEKGKNPLICIGINPSTASPLKLDPTVRNVSTIAKLNGFDGWMMMNIYPQRATLPEDMDKESNDFLISQNTKAFDYILDSVYNKKPTIWAAWGTIINKRPFLYNCLSELYKVSVKYDANWISFGNCSKDGHPHHPLYLKLDSGYNEFDIETYVNNFCNKKNNA